MRIVDDDFVRAVEHDLGPYVERVDIDRGRPFFDVEVIRRPHVDVPRSSSSNATSEELVRQVGLRLVDRVRELRAQFGAELSSDLLVSYGDPTCGGSSIDADTRRYARAWASALEQASNTHARGRWMSVAEHLCGGSGEDADRMSRARARDLAAVFRLHTGEREEAEAYIVVVGLDPTVRDARRGGPDCRVTKLVRSLATHGGRTAPVYLVGVTPRDVFGGTESDGWDGRALMRFLQGLRMSLVLHDGVETSGLLTVSATEAIGEDRLSREATFVACPTFKAGEGTPGMIRLRLDLRRLVANVGFGHDLGSDRGPSRPIQVVRPLVSVSRVSGAERNLYLKVSRMLGEEKGKSSVSPKTREEIAEFERHVQATWETDGYVPLCNDSGRLPDIPATRRTSYLVLLLLRQRRDGGYDLLMSNHTPLSQPVLARWDTLLLPAFKQPKALLDRLRDDVLRQAVAQTEDVERAERARSFEDAVARILSGDAQEAEDWDNQTRELATLTTRKISPTDGRVTEYRYRLVTLLPLVDRGVARDEDRGSDASKVVDWLDGLETIRADGMVGEGIGGIALEALRREGAGLRWDPAVELAERRDGSQRRRSRKVPRGVVWFPLSDGKPLWRDCPSILARNADVMLWLEGELERLRSGDRFPAHVVLDRHRPAQSG